VDVSVTELALKYGPIAALAIYAASIAITKFFSGREGVTESSARVDVIDMLTARVRMLEESQTTYQRQFEEERQSRMRAEDNVATLTRRVSTLEAQLRDLGHEPR
jgi:hypothetical protein